MITFKHQKVDWLIAVGPWQNEAAVKKRLGWRYWPLRMLNPQARHVVLFAPANTMTIAIQKMPWGMYVDIFPIYVLDFAASFEHYRLYKKTIDYRTMDYRASFGGLFSCVEMAKQVLGIKNKMIFTPKQLERELIKNAERFDYKEADPRRL